MYWCLGGVGKGGGRGQGRRHGGGGGGWVKRAPHVEENRRYPLPPPHTHTYPPALQVQNGLTAPSAPKPKNMPRMPAPSPAPRPTGAGGARRPGCRRTWTSTTQVKWPCGAQPRGRAMHHGQAWPLEAKRRSGIEPPNPDPDPGPGPPASPYPLPPSHPTPLTPTARRTIGTPTGSRHSEDTGVVGCSRSHARTAPSNASGGTASSLQPRGRTPST